MNRFLTVLKITRRSAILLVLSVALSSSIRTPLLEQLKERGSITVVTRNSPTAYYEDRNGPTGYEYELAKAFADYLGLELNLMIVTNQEEVLNALKSGKADMAAAGLSKEQTSESPLAYSPAYASITQQIIYHRRNRKPESLKDMQDSRLMVPAGSRHAYTLRRWQHSEIPSLTWRETHDYDSSDLLQMISDKELDYTLVNSNDFQLMRTYLPNLDVAFTLGDLQSVAWMFPDTYDRSVIERAYDFFYRPEAGVLMASLSERYYGHVEKFDYVGAHRFLRQTKRVLPRYENHFRQAADKYGFDWRLIAAMGYQESHWQRNARSFTGVRGLMMLTMATAQEMGIEDRLDPKQSIFGGTRYLNSVRNRLDESIQEPDRTWMAMAAYNVGLGHLEDARMLAEDLGRDPNLWLDIKETLPLLSQRRYYSKTRYGYARGNEPVTYVQNIRRYYDVLVWNAEQVNKNFDDSADNAVTVIPPLQ
ncbi:MAG: membrane-bound lytic murein transglycosylase MltF [Oleibacter sp.]|nr:membrane-bound lytic murein transglycosylase MltF [Thalassolituus sp.]